MQASAPHLIALKALVQTVSSSTTLKVNFAKSGVIPLNLDEDNALLLASTYGCSLISLPFTYLGIPLSASKPKVIDFSPLTDQIERRIWLPLSLHFPMGIN